MEFRARETRSLARRLLFGLGEGHLNAEERHINISLWSATSATRVWCGTIETWGGTLMQSQNYCRDWLSGWLVGFYVDTKTRYLAVIFLGVLGVLVGTHMMTASQSHWSLLRFQAVDRRWGIKWSSLRLKRWYTTDFRSGWNVSYDFYFIASHGTFSYLLTDEV